jgi:hypothetical protein
MEGDIRDTNSVGGSFYPQVLDLYNNKQQAGVLYEDNGVTRANGLITAMYEKDGFQWMRLNEDLEIRIDKLYAVNGRFASDYSEC